jgi:hypothetical protein
MEDAELDAYTDRVACLLVQQTTRFLDTLNALLGFQRDIVALIRVFDAIGVIVGHELALRSIFVTLVGVGVINDYAALVSL